MPAWILFRAAVFATLFLGTIAATDVQDLPEGSHVRFRSGVETVGMSVTVRDRHNRLITDLTRDDFRLVINRRPVAIDVFSRESRPLAVAILAHTAGGREPVKNVRRVARALVDALAPEDRAVIGVFSHSVAISPVITSDRPTLHRVLTEELWPAWGYPLGTAVDRAISSLAAERGKRVVVVITSDPRESCIWMGVACVGAGAARRRAVEDDVMVYGLSLPASPTDVLPSDRPLLRMAHEAGGGYLRLRSTETGLASIMEEVVGELRHDYLLGFTPSEQDGRERTVDVRLNRSGLTARARRTYRLSSALK
jgi:VWFA-related protein